MSKKKGGGKAPKAPPFIPDFSEVPVLGKSQTLWAEGKQKGGEPLAPFEKEDLCGSVKTSDFQWNEAVAKAIMASDITSTCINAVVTTLEGVAMSQAMKKALKAKASELPADEWLGSYMPQYVDHQDHVQETHMASNVVVASADVEAMGPKELPPKRPTDPGWDANCAWCNKVLRRRHELIRELEANGVNLSTVRSAQKKFVQKLLPKYLDKGATADSLLAAHMYTTETPALYRIINGGLRAGSNAVLEKMQVFFAALVQALEALDGNVGQEPLYRGQDKIYGKDVTVGATVSWEAFTSVSTEERVARGFAGGGVLFKLHDVPPTVGASLTPLSAYPNEAEILLPPGAAFTVTKDSQEADCRLIELTFIGVHQPTLAAGFGVKSPLEVVVGKSLCSDCAWQSLSKALRPFHDGRAAQDLVQLHPQFLAPRINHMVPNTRGPPLWVAARNMDSPELLKALLEVGADPQGTDTTGSTALHMASFYGHVECVKCLLEADPAVEETCQKQDKHHHTALDMAKRHEGVVAAFAEAGIDVNSVALASQVNTPAPASRCPTPLVTARDVCGMIGLTPTPRSYDAALFNQRSPSRNSTISEL